MRLVANRHPRIQAGLAVYAVAVTLIPILLFSFYGPGAVKPLGLLALLGAAVGLVGYAVLLNWLAFRAGLTMVSRFLASVGLVAVVWAVNAVAFVFVVFVAGSHTLPLWMGAMWGIWAAVIACEVALNPLWYRDRE